MYNMSILFKLQEDNFGVPKKQQTEKHMDALLSAIHTCGVGFKVEICYNSHTVICPKT